MIVLFYYFSGMIIAFMVITISAYYDLKEQYFIIPTINNIWDAIVIDDSLALYVCAVIFYPIALLYAVFLMLALMFDSFVKLCVWVFTPNAKIIKGKIALLKVGDYVKCTRDTNLTLDGIREDQIIAIQDDKIFLEHDNCNSKIIRKKNFLLYKDELVGIAEIDKI